MWPAKFPKYRFVSPGSFTEYTLLASQPNSMNRLTKLQLLGPAVLLLTVIAAEIAAAALAHWPSSGFLWHANLKWFHAFQASNYALGAYETMSYSQFWLVAVPLFVIGYGGIIFHRPLLLAISSNLSFVYASFVLYAGYLYGQSGRQASLSLMTVWSAPAFPISFVLIAASFLSFAVSHLYYIRAVRGDIR